MLLSVAMHEQLGTFLRFPSYFEVVPIQNFVLSAGHRWYLNISCTEHSGTCTAVHSSNTCVPHSTAKERIMSVLHREGQSVSEPPISLTASVHVRKPRQIWHHIIIVQQYTHGHRHLVQVGWHVVGKKSTEYFVRVIVVFLRCLVSSHVTSRELLPGGTDIACGDIPRRFGR